MSKLKFNVGDLVVVPDRSTVTDILADAIGDVEDGLITGKEECEMEARLYAGDPMRVHAIEDGGYILGLPGGRKGLTGVMWDDDLRAVV